MVTAYKQYCLATGATQGNITYTPLDTTTILYEFLILGQDVLRVVPLTFGYGSFGFFKT